MRKYGKVSYDQASKSWKIAAEPQVVLRLKRVFDRIRKNDSKEILIRANPESSRELEWFLQRFPMDIDRPDILTEMADEHRRVEETVSQILSGDYTPSEFTELALPPREYQRTAAELAMSTGRLLLCDELGTGKTVSAICTLTDPENLPALVVTLTHLPKQWQSEINRFAPSLRTHIVKQGTPYDLTKGKNGKYELFPDVIIINYAKLFKWAEALVGVISSVIYDEVQELRREASKKYEAAETISTSCKLRLGTSGTPIYNYGGEIFNVVSCIAPGELGTRAEFLREWCDSYNSDKPKIRDPKAFGSYMREHGLMLRRTRQDVGREIPEVTKVPHTIESDPKELDKIEDSASELAKIILSQGESQKGEKMMASEQLSNVLRQYTGISKAPYCADFIRMVAESGEPVVVYGWHREFYSILHSKLKDLDPVFYTGSETTAEKELAKNKFVNGDTDIFIMSLRSGAGLDGLQFRCRTAIYGELDWSPGVQEQALGRIHRDGQKNPVLAYYLLSEYGSDPIMADVLGLKKSQLTGIIDPEASVVTKSAHTEKNAKKLAEEFLSQRGINPHQEEAGSNVIQFPGK